MPHTIDIAGARRLLRTRDDLIAQGLTERDIEREVDAGRTRRVRHGRYVDEEGWKDLWNEGRHLVEVLAVHLNSAGSGPVFCGPSAAVLHGLPLYRLAPADVHVAIEGRRHGRTRAEVIWHNTNVPPGDIVEIDGVRCTSLDRTVLDLARSLGDEVAIAAADAALRSESVTGHHYDENAAARWRERMLARAARVHGRGIRGARRLIEFADGRAQLPGESVSRLLLMKLGYSAPELQVSVSGPDGEEYWADFGFRRARCFGEFDGRGKYFDDDKRGGLTPEQVLIAEKRREDAIRGVTGWRVVRWGWGDIKSLDSFSARLLAFGLRPPG